MSLIRATFDAISSFFATILNTVIGQLTPRSPIRPEQAMDYGVNIVKVAGTAILGFAGMTVIGELLHPLKELGLGQFAAMLYHMSGYEIITRQLVGPLARAGIGIPMSYYVMSQVLPMVLDVRQASEAWAMGFLNDADFKQHLRYAGFPGAYDAYFMEAADVDLSIREIVQARSRGYLDDKRFDKALRIAGADFQWRDVWDELAKTPVRYFALRAVAAGGYYDYRIFEKDMMRAGYPKETRDMLHQMYAALSSYEVKGIYVGTAMSRYSSGLITLEQLDDELTMLRTPEALRQIYATAGQLMRDTKIRQDAIKEVTRAYQHRKLSIEQASSILQELGIEDSQVQAWMLNELKLLPEDIYQTPEEEVRAYGRSTVTKRYREGFIDDAQFAQEMLMCGYTLAQIERFTMIARLEYDYDFAMDLLGTAKDAYSKGLIDDGEFLDWLARIPVGAERAKSYLLREQIRKAKRIAS